MNQKQPPLSPTIEPTDSNQRFGGSHTSCFCTSSAQLTANRRSFGIRPASSYISPVRDGGQPAHRKPATRQINDYLRVSTDARGVANPPNGVTRYRTNKRPLEPIFIEDPPGARPIGAPSRLATWSQGQDRAM
jgi:hypothetical protein